jgi:pimeloyl-ACP methyl ester carboxylesterase
MATAETIDRIPGDTPVRHVPSDYYPAGCGFWFQLPDGLDKGKKMFYRDSVHGEGDAKGTIVLVHGNPECSYAFRNISNEMKRSAGRPFRVVAMDHIGFGLSDQASFQMVPMDHAANLLQLIRHLGLRDLTLLVHDWGGPIGIGALLREPERVANLVILNTTVFPIPSTGLTYDKNYPMRLIPWSRFPLTTPDFLWGAVMTYAISCKRAGAFRLVGGMLAHIVRTSLGIYPRGEKEAQAVFKEQFRSKANTRSSKQLVRQTAFWGHGNSYREPRLGLRDTSEFYRFIQDHLGPLWGPDGQNIGVRALVGRWDPLGKDGVIAQWVEHLPQVRHNIQLFDNTGHFINIERPEEIGKATLDVAGLL